MSTPAAPVGAVALLRRFPLKSAAGELPARVDVGPAGLVHDRAWAVVGQDGAPLRTRDHPWLADLAAEVVDGALVVRVDGRALAGEQLRAALGGLAGAPVDVAPLPPADPAQGTAPVHLISEHAERDPTAPTDCDLGHRANLVLALGAGLAPGAERAWVGRRLRVGGAELVVTRTPRRCLGVYADVARPGPVAVGDRALVIG